MSLSTALSMARSGLGATAIQADILSRNIANADTPGHTRKLGKLVTGPTGEVTVKVVDRSVDALLSRLDRGNASELSARGTIAEGVRAYTNYLGQPSEEISPAAMVDRFNQSLILLSGLPSDQSAQIGLVSSAKNIARGLNDLAAVLGDVTSEVSHNIRYDISSANEALQEIAFLNKKIFQSEKGSVVQAEHLDQLDRMIDAASEFMDIQTVTTRDGMVNIYTGSGVELVVGEDVHALSYNPVSNTLVAGTVDITPGSTTARGLTQGSLSGLFALKDRILPEYGAQLDSLAGALVQGLEGANPFGSGGQGILTDAGNPFDAGSVAGLSSRIRINSEVDPEQGGDASLVQSGGAGLPIGDNSLIEAMAGALSAPVSVDTAGLGADLSILTLSSTLVTSQQTKRAGFESDAAATSVAGQTISASRVNFQGVNIDDEMQKLLLIQQSYAANAKVLTAVSEMLDTLIGAVR